jgi:soluble lytic murein transglycosylase-like protein
MRWMIRTVAGLSVVSWLVAASLFAHPVGALAENVVAHSLMPAAPQSTLPHDWMHRVLAGTRELFPGASQLQTEMVVPIVERHARRFRVDPLMVLAVIQVESRFDPNAVSDQGAIGLMQLQSATARDLAMDLGVEWTGDELLLNPELNVELGCAYLRRLMDRFGDQDAALAAYCSGPTLVEARRDANGRIPLAYSDRVWDVLTALRGKVVA